MKNNIPGTIGYAQVKQQFIDATLAIDFWELHKDFVPFFPKKPSHILDVGAGIGRDAFEFSQIGHSVVAVEPSQELRNAGKQLYEAQAIQWLDDALPELKKLEKTPVSYDFVLASGVWHHLTPKEQKTALQRISLLMAPNAFFALTLRNGPAGAGLHVFPTNGKETITNALEYGLTVLLSLENQPSLMKNKTQVTWTKIVFQKQE